MTQGGGRTARERDWERGGHLRHPGQVFSANGKAADDAAPEDDPAESAKAAGLRYVSADAPGIRRVKSGSGFKYVGPRGKPVRDDETLGRIKSLVIPPAWTDVWI